MAEWEEAAPRSFNLWTPNSVDLSDDNYAVSVYNSGLMCFINERMMLLIHATFYVILLNLIDTVSSQSREYMYLLIRSELSRSCWHTTIICLYFCVHWHCTVISDNSTYDSVYQDGICQMCLCILLAELLLHNQSWSESLLGMIWHSIWLSQPSQAQ